MCFTFLKALGHNIGNSLCDDELIISAKEILESADGKKIILPIDFGVTKSIAVSYTHLRAHETLR